MSRLTWELGTVRVDFHLEAVPRDRTAEEGIEEREAHGANSRELRALVSGPFAIHPIEHWLALTHVGTGMRIGRCYTDRALLNLLDLADRLADLDWTGEPRELSERNRDAVLAAWEEVLRS